jgi:hypothetical protein
MSSMTTDFANSNLSKIRPKLRTQGVVSGNFGKAKVKSGSSLKELGNTNVKVVKCDTQDEYLTRLYKAFDATNDSKLKQFIYTEIRKIHIQRGEW